MFSNRFAWPDAPIDAFTLLDLTMLHELTHTRAGGEKDDVSSLIVSHVHHLNFRQVVVPSASSRGKEKDKDGYGWKTCRKLAETGIGHHNESGSPRGPMDNADSIALFASGECIHGLHGCPQTDSSQR